MTEGRFTGHQNKREGVLGFRRGLTSQIWTTQAAEMTRRGMGHLREDIHRWMNLDRLFWGGH